MEDREAREISLRRQQLKREQDFRLIRSVTLDDLSKKIQDGQVKELNVVVKGDVDGSVGALADSLMKITHAEVRVNVIHRAVGAISESDVLLAAASGAIIIGFHVRPNLNSRVLSEQENVDIRLYNIIYDAIEDVRKAGFERVRVDGETLELSETIALDRYRSHDVVAIVDRLIVRGGADGLDRTRLVDSLETALKMGDGVVIVARVGARDNAPDLLFSEHFARPECGLTCTC